MNVRLWSSLDATLTTIVSTAVLYVLALPCPRCRRR